MGDVMWEALLQRGSFLTWKILQIHEFLDMALQMI